MFIGICILAFFVSFFVSVIVKLTYKPGFDAFQVKWSDQMGEVYTDLRYGDKPAETFDLYVPNTPKQKEYNLVVYIHAGGFTSGDKSDDKAMLEWLCSKGYVAAGINYTLCSEENPDSNVYTQSKEIQASIPAVVKEAEKLGYPLKDMAIGGGSAGGTLALLYGYRDVADSVLPVKFVFEAVGPASFQAQDWKSYGLDQSPEAAAVLFSVMSGQSITPEMIEKDDYADQVKNISAWRWITSNSAPAVLAYGVYDKICPYASSLPLQEALKKNGVDHTFIVLPHSGHGLQNDDKLNLEYMQQVEKGLETWLPANPDIS